MLGLSSFEAGHIMTSAFFIAFTAFTVNSSGSPGPTPIPINSGMRIMLLFPIKKLDYLLVADIIVTGFLASIMVPVVVFLLFEIVT